MDMKITSEELTAGIKVKTGEISNLRMPSVLCFLDINPNDAKSRDDKYTLKSTDENNTYKKTLTIQDDIEPGNDFLELCFYGTCEDLGYTLEIDPGAEGDKYNVFENIPYSQLSSI